MTSFSPLSPRMLSRTPNEGPRKGYYAQLSQLCKTGLKFQPSETEGVLQTERFSRPLGPAVHFCRAGIPASHFKPLVWRAGEIRFNRREIWADLPRLVPTMSWKHPPGRETGHGAGEGLPSKGVMGPHWTKKQLTC